MSLSGVGHDPSRGKPWRRHYPVLSPLFDEGLFYSEDSQGHADSPGEHGIYGLGLTFEGIPGASTETFTSVYKSSRSGTHHTTHHITTHLDNDLPTSNSVSKPVPPPPSPWCVS
jgi:hypothetical protein